MTPSTMIRGLKLVTALVGMVALAAQAEAAHRTHGGHGSGVPDLDVRGSCSDAQKFSSQGSGDGNAYKGCIQDEMNAKNELVRRWSSFKPKDRLSCVEQARTPSPSYVEVLTCLEMNTPQGPAPGGQGGGSQIGGPLAPGLAPTTPGAATTTPATAPAPSTAPAPGAAAH